MAENIKNNLQKHENSISFLETIFEQLQLVLEEEQQRANESMDEIKHQMQQLTTANADGGKIITNLMELLKGNLKGKQAETPEMGSSTQIHKPEAARNTGYPPGFVPSTPTHFATYNDN